MTFHKHILPFAALAAVALATQGCSLFHSHHDQKPKSAFKIIPEGEKNPSIIDSPEVVRDTPTQRVEVSSGPVGQQ
jgi:hypothetical protein